MKSRGSAGVNRRSQTQPGAFTCHRVQSCSYSPLLPGPFAFSLHLPERQNDTPSPLKNPPQLPLGFLLLPCLCPNSVFSQPLPNLPPASHAGQIQDQCQPELENPGVSESPLPQPLPWLTQATTLQWPRTGTAAEIFGFGNARGSSALKTGSTTLCNGHPLILRVLPDPGSCQRLDQVGLGVSGVGYRAEVVTGK